VEGADEEGGVSEWRCAGGLRRSVVRGIWLLCLRRWMEEGRSWTEHSFVFWSESTEGPRFEWVREERFCHPGG
jgi:hypothetical protein